MEGDLLACASRVEVLSLSSERSQPLASTANIDAINETILGIAARLASGHWTICFWDLPFELRQMIYRFACPGYYVDVSHIEDWWNSARMPARLRSEYLERYHDGTTFMLHVRNVDREDRACTWHNFMESMSNAQAGHLKHLIFYFPQFVLKVHVSPESLTRLTYDYVADYGESASGASVLKYEQITTLVKGWIEFRLEILSSRCHSQRFARKDINRIAKLAFELVPRLHIWLLPHRFTDHSFHADGIAEHAWECQECSWTREMLD